MMAKTVQHQNEFPVSRARRTGSEGQVSDREPRV